MDPLDIAFLRRFKDEVRNPYQHADEAQIVDNLFVRVCPIQGLSLEKVNQTIKDIASGKLKPKLLPAAEIPAFRAVVKREYDRKRAISLFSEVYDFLLVAKVKYFRQEDYDEHFKRFGSRLDHIEHYKCKCFFNSAKKRLLLALAHEQLKSSNASQTFNPPTNPK